MPRTRKPKPTDIPETILDQFGGAARPMSQGDLDAITKRFKKALVERMLGGELTHHLGCPPGGEKPSDGTNHRNGSSAKTVLTDEGPLTLDIPRDRDGTFEPRLIGKHERRFTGFDDKILALYARGMTVREIQAFLTEMYQVEVSPDFISTCHGRRAHGGDGVAGPSARADVSRGVFRCPPRHDSRRRDRPEQGGLSGAGDPAGRQPRHPRHLDRAGGRREMLDEGLHRPENPRLPGHLDCGDGWPEGHERSVGGDLPRHRAADVHRPSVAP